MILKFDDKNHTVTYFFYEKIHSEQQMSKFTNVVKPVQRYFVWQHIKTAVIFV